MAGEKNFIIKNGLTVGSTEIINSSGIVAGSAVNEAIDDRLNSTLVAGSGITLAYDDSANTLTVTGNVGDITGVNAGAGLTGTATSGDATLNIGAGTGITVNADTIEVDQSVIRGLISTGGDLAYNSSTGFISYTQSDTDGVSEGSTNLYHTSERVDDRVASLIVGGTGITSTYDDAAGTLTINGQVGDITGVTAGTGLSGGGTSGDVTLAVSGLTLAELDGSALIISSESFTDNDTTVMSSAAIQDKIEAYGYSTTVGDITSVVAGSGLSGGGTAGDVTLTLDTGAVFSEAVADTVGAMVGSNTESGITVAYDDADNTLDFTVATLNQDTTGNAATATALETSRTISGTSFDGTSNVTLNTSAITENTNLYYTDERVDDRVSSLIVGGTGITSTYDDAAGTLTLVSEVGDITSVVAGSGLSGGGVTGDVTLTLDTGAVFQEAVADTVGAMVTSNTESGITVAYDDADNTLDFTVATLNQDTTGNAATATALETSRTISGTSFDGTSNVTLNTSAITENTNLYYTDERVDDRVSSLIVGGTGITSTYDDAAGTLTLVSEVGDITSVVAGSGLSGGGVTGDVTLTLDTGAVFQEAVADTVGAMVTSNTESGITVAYVDADNTLDFTISTLNQSTTGNAATATALETARTIGGVSFDGTAAINLPGVNSAGNQSTSGLAGTATALATARTIHGVSFDGTANISLAEEIQDTVGAMFTGNTESGITVAYDDADGTVDFTVGTLNQNTSGNAATATALATSRTIHGVGFDGTANIDLSEVVQDTVGAMFTSNTESGITVAYQDADGTVDFTVGTLNQNTTGSAATLTTARTIQGVSFDGSANITTMTAGTGVSVSGTAVSIGQAVATSSNVTFGDLTLSGDLTVNGTTTSVASTNTTMTDGLIELANGTTGTPANDTGIVIERGTAANAFMGWDESADKFTMGTGTFTGASTGSLSITTGTLVANLEGNVTGNTSGSSGSTTGNAATATALATARTIALGGDLSGSASFDGTGNISITAVVADDSHNHTIANVDGLQTSLNTKYASGSNIVAGTLTTSNASNSGGYVRNMYQSTSAPVSGDGAVGDMWVLYS